MLELACAAPSAPPPELARAVPAPDLDVLAIAHLARTSTRLARALLMHKRVAELNQPRDVIALAYSWGDETHLSFKRVALTHASTRSFLCDIVDFVAPTARCRASPTPSASTPRHCASPSSLCPSTT